MNHIESILHFSRRLDEMKTVLRRTRVIATGQFEDDAQHSWHISAMAVLLADYANEPVNLEKTIKMLLFHDVVELEAGDTFCYDVNANKDKQEREAIAARNIYGRLPNGGGGSWKEHGIKHSQVLARIAPVKDGCAPLYDHVRSLVEEGVQKGWLIDA